MSVYFHQTSQFQETRIQIEQHLFDSVLKIEKNLDLALQSVEQFAHAMDRLLDMLEQLYQTPGPKDNFGEKSFPIREGRYRVFYKVMVRGGQDFDITLLDIDDNRQSNLDRFPEHQMITFYSEE